MIRSGSFRNSKQGPQGPLPLAASGAQHQFPALPRSDADRSGSDKFHRWLDDYARKIAAGVDVAKRLTGGPQDRSRSDSWTRLSRSPRSFARVAIDFYARGSFPPADLTARMDSNI